MSLRCTALMSFRRNLSLVKELGDRAAQGRAYGNLGNTQYLLGNFSEAIGFHKEVGTCSSWGQVLRVAAFLLTSARKYREMFSIVLTHAEQHLTPIPSAPTEQLEGRVLLAWKLEETSKGRWQLLICMGLDFNKCKP